jgi:hypothetical protein
VLRDNTLISKIIQLSNELEDSLIFHKKSQYILKKMGKLDFVSEVFESNLLDNLFLKRKWTSFDIPHLSVYTNDDIDLKYHIFLPPKSKNTEMASYLIHHHMDHTLSSYVFFGEGYHTIQFNKEITTNSDGTINMRISKDFFHANSEINILDSWSPHVIFNVPKTTTTLVLWSKSNNSDMGIKKRENYYPDKGNFMKISDEEFVIEAKKEDEYDENSDNHIQAICYFMQEIGYKNTSFLKRIIQSSDLPVTWKKWLSLLLSDNVIQAPYFDDEINILKKQISIADIRNANS